jgi:hypothetical protein
MTKKRKDTKTKKRETPNVEREKHHKTTLLWAHHCLYHHNTSFLI